METFLSIHQEQVVNTLSTYDRMIFKGHISQLFYANGFTKFLQTQKVLLKDFKGYVMKTSEKMKAHVQKLVQEAGRPYQYLETGSSAMGGNPKEGIALEIAKRDGVTEGLICVLAAVEKCLTFSVRKNQKNGLLETYVRPSKCLHYYFYYLDPIFGFMHVRMQSWFPFQIQIYINGREWLARELDQQHIHYERYDNSLIQCDDWKTAQACCEKMAHYDWPPVLQAFAKRLNPFLPLIQEAHFGSYYWVIDQCEFATDVVFKDRATLAAILPDLYEHAILQCSAEDILRFLGHKIHGNFTGEVTSSWKKRPEGWRVKHHLKRNTLKVYDKWNILRVETTINNPSDFKVSVETDDHKRRWKPMGKGVSNLWRYVQVSLQANQRYLEGLAQAKLKSKVIGYLDDLCRSHSKEGKRFARFNPLSWEDCALFQTILSGDFAINGFRNHDLARRLFPKVGPSPKEQKQCCARISRLIAKLRAHGLIAKVKDARLYRVTDRGHCVLLAILNFRHCDFPAAFSSAP